MGLLFVVRHGQASFGTDNYDRLSDLGARQATLLARYLIATGRRFDAVYAGRMERQRRTAETVTDLYRREGIPVPDVEILPEFDEYDSRRLVMSFLGEAGDVKHLYGDPLAFQHFFAHIVERWITGETTIDGVVSWGEFRARVRRGLEKITGEGRGKKVMVVTSGGPISVVFQAATDISDAATLKIVWQIVNTSVSTFLFDGARFSLLSFNQTAHLELEGDHSLLTFR